MTTPCCGTCRWWEYRRTVPIPPDNGPREEGECYYGLEDRGKASWCFRAYDHAPCKLYLERGTSP